MGILPDITHALPIGLLTRGVEALERMADAAERQATTLDDHTTALRLRWATVDLVERDRGTMNPPRFRPTPRDPDGLSGATPDGSRS